MRYKPLVIHQEVLAAKLQMFSRAVFISLALLVVLLVRPVDCVAAATDLIAMEGQWQPLGKGLELGTFRIPAADGGSGSLFFSLRIDPQHYRFQLLNLSAQPRGRLLTAKQWCLQFGMVAAINASMYQKDYKTSVSYMRTRHHVNNPRLSKDMCLLAFGRRSKNLPLVKLIDRQCDDFSQWKKHYITWIQSIRMISCTGANVWRQQAHKWSTAALATDRQGRILFIYVGSPFSTHDLINILKQLPLSIDRAMYLEGGPQAQLFIKAGGVEHDFSGGSRQHKSTPMVFPIDYPIPNVIAIKPRKPETR